MKITPLPYVSDLAQAAGNFLDLPNFIWLDSCRPHTAQGRYDIIAAGPRVLLTTTGDTTCIISGDKKEYSNALPLDILRANIAKSSSNHASLPFTGGALGYLAYELLTRLPASTNSVIDLPQMVMGIYDWAIVCDHHLCCVHLVDRRGEVSIPMLTHQAIIERYLSTSSKKLTPFMLRSEWASNTSKADYRCRLAEIETLLRAGDVYQLNFTHCFGAKFAGDPWLAYCALRQENPTPFAAFMRCAQGDILSLSPERFLHCDSGVITCQPIKGTRPRYETSHADEQAKQQLMHSAKDRAENVMIVDLIRNDLSRVCKPQTVKVPALCELHSFSAVHHLISTVTGELDPRYDALDAINAAFPCGSITGAPKISAMKHIAQLELQQRSVYCGSIGYLDSTTRCDFNIAIRTILAVNQRLFCAAGGGIVLDSNSDSEYQESVDKITRLCNTLTRLKDKTA